MRWISFTVLAATLVILASISVVVAVPTPTMNAPVPRALKQYKMRRPDVKRDVLNEKYIPRFVLNNLLIFEFLQ